MKIKRNIFILLALVGVLVLPRSVQALDLKITYNETWKECFDYVHVLPNYDNDGDIDGYLYLTNNGITKQDLNNKIVYENKTSNVSNVNVTTIKSSNIDGYVVNGETDILIIGYDDNDDVIFEKQYGGNGIDAEPDVINSYNNNGELDGYLIVFITTSSDLGVEQGFALLKVNLDGNVVWTKNFNEEFRLETLIYTKNQSIYDVELIDKTKLKSTSLLGNVAWEKDTGINVKNINYSYNKDGKIDGFVVAGNGENGADYVGTLIKYDLDGNEVFRSKYDKTNMNSFYYDVISSYLPDGSYDGYIVTGSTECVKRGIECFRSTFLVKYDFNGNKTYEKNYSTTNKINFRIINNFDNARRQNGYLLYSLGYYKPDMRKNEVATLDLSCRDLVTAKYTYDIFPVAKEEADGGTISVKTDAYPGEIVKVKVAVKEGYTLARIIVKDENGKEIEVNSDGTFLMPDGKVTVSAIYKRLSNPDTMSAAYMVLGIVLLIAVGSLIVVKQKNKENI